MRFLLLTLVTTLLIAAPAFGDTLDDRAKILHAEMTRDAASLHPWLKPDADPALRRTAIRALGRIGDDGTGPGMLRDMLATETKDLRLLLWSAGIARTKELAEPIAEQLAKQLAAKQWIYAAEAARALGWTGADGLGDTLRPLLAHPQAAVRAGALEGLGRSGAKERQDLLAAGKLTADANADVQAAAYYACWAIDDASPEEAHRAATLAIAFASDAFPQLGGTAIQVFGGIGFTWEHDIHLYYKRLLTLSVALGTPADHLEELATIAIP